MVMYNVYNMGLLFQIYKNLYGAMIQGKNALQRPSWWREFLHKPDVGGALKAKI